jgi:hypothetical protein
MRHCNYLIVSNFPNLPIVLEDLGPWDKYMTITNAAEEVVEELTKAGKIFEGRRLLYYDSEGELTELAHKDGKFVGFKFVDPSNELKTKAGNLIED